MIRWNMEPIALDEVKKIELDLLRHFAQQCESNGLRYFLSAGTMLGAIRHKGFIPWDDDIDVTMPREDYERYWKLFETINDCANISLTSYRDKSSIYPFFKLVDNRTIVFEQYVDKRSRTGVWIDIFPIDGIPNEKLYKENDRAQKLYAVVTADPSKGTSPMRKIAKRILKPVYSRKDIYDIAKRLDDAAAANPIVEGEPLGEVIWGYGVQEIMPYEFLDAIEVEFEGGRFKAPRIYDTYLTSLFGDYMTPPPENERVSHGFFAYWKDGIDRGRG